MRLYIHVNLHVRPCIVLLYEYFSRIHIGSYLKRPEFTRQPMYMASVYTRGLNLDLVRITRRIGEAVRSCTSITVRSGEFLGLRMRSGSGLDCLHKPEFF